MLKNYLKIAWRHLVRQKKYSLITILGLSVGLLCSLLITLYVIHELSYDSFHENSERIYRLTHESPPSDLHFARCPQTWVNHLPDEYPEVEQLVRFQTSPLIEIKSGDQKYRMEDVFKTDAHIFDVFDFPLVQGNPASALTEPNSVVLSQSTARKMFGDENPMGREVIMVGNVASENYHCRVTGLMKDVPDNSHMDINMLFSWQGEEDRAGWAYNYLLLAENSSADQLEAKLPGFIEKYGGENANDFTRFHLQPLESIHLHSHLSRELQPNGNIIYIYIFIAVAAFIVIIASINFVNITTARSIHRSREIGIRKTLGSSRRQLLGYFLTESVFQVVISGLIALLLALTLLPLFRQFTEAQIQTGLLFSWEFPVLFFSAIFIIGFISGLYPAFMIAKFNPVHALKSKNPSMMKRGFSGEGLSLRKGLLVLQFTLSIILVAATLVNWQQFKYVQNKNLGFDTEQTIVLRDLAHGVMKDYHLLKSRLQQHANILDVSASMEEPSREIADKGTVYAEGKLDHETSPFFRILPVDKNFRDFMGMELAAGRDFSHLTSETYPEGESENVIEFMNQKDRSYMLNEAAVRAIGWEDAESAVGKQVSWSNGVFQLQRGPVVGVLEDFHFNSLHEEIHPVIIVYEPVWLRAVLVKLPSDNIQPALATVRDTWNSMYPDYPFDYQFMDQMFADLYRAEMKLGQILMLFSGVAIFIACFGLFGLAALTIEQRTKEIGIRKVLGASVAGIVQMLSADFAKWVLVANLFAWPLAYYALSRWLQNFAYHIELQWWTFIFAGGAALLIALLTVSVQALQAALTNPVETIRTE